MATKAQQKENLEKVTDYVEERQLDADRMAKAMSNLTSVSKAQADAEKAREWASVKVSAEDVAFVAGELEVGKEQAELALKQQQGDVAKAIRQLLHE